MIPVIAIGAVITNMYSYLLKSYFKLGNANCLRMRMPNISYQNNEFRKVL